MDSDSFDNVTWQNDEPEEVQSPGSAKDDGAAAVAAAATTAPPIGGGADMERRDSTRQAGTAADAVDLAGIGDGVLECKVDAPVKEGEGSQNAYISYLVTTHTDFKSFTRSDCSVRRRFTDFVFLWKSLTHDYPACAVPPLPDKHKMEYVRGDRFGPEFTGRRAHSLHRFLNRLTLHPVLRRASLLVIFLESSDWNAHMRVKGSRNSGSGVGVGGGGGSGSGGPDGGNSMFDNFTDTFVNAFSKVHKPDRRFIEVRDRCDKLDEDLGHVEKIVTRVARRESDLEADFAELSVQFLKLAVLEPGVETPVHAFAQAVGETAAGLSGLREHTDRDYLSSLRDMEAYVGSVKALLRTREQKQLDFEGLTEYLAKAAADRDMLASPHHAASGLSNPASFIRAKVEDIRGVDHEAARRERLRRLELQIERLTAEVENARRTAEMFDEETVKEVDDFERIRAAEFRDTLGALAERHVTFYEGVIDTWERYVKDMEAEGYST